MIMMLCKAAEVHCSRMCVIPSEKKTHSRNELEYTAHWGLPNLHERSVLQNSVT